MLCIKVIAAIFAYSLSENAKVQPQFEKLRGEPNIGKCILAKPYAYACGEGWVRLSERLRH